MIETAQPTRGGASPLPLLLRLALLAPLLLPLVAACPAAWARPGRGFRRSGGLVGIGGGARGTLVRIVNVRYAGGKWNPRPGFTGVLAQEVAFRTSIDTDFDPPSVALDAPALFDDPILVMSGDQAFPPLPEAHLERLRHHVEAGGFLLLDNAGSSGRAAAGFDGSIRRLVGRLFPSAELKAIPSEHVIYRSFFRLDYPSGRNLRKGYMEGVTLGRRVAVVYSPNDLGGALERDRFGAWAHDLVPGTGRQREMAIRMGVNLVMYALCLHYKDDQVHLRYLLKRRKWRIEPPLNP